MAQVLHQTGDGVENLGFVLGRRGVDVSVADLPVLVDEKESGADVIAVGTDPDAAIALQFRRRDHFAKGDAREVLALKKVLFLLGGGGGGGRISLGRVRRYFHG